jgi:hypothetical protein
VKSDESFLVHGTGGDIDVAAGFVLWEIVISHHLSSFAVDCSWMLFMMAWSLGSSVTCLLLKIHSYSL